MNRKITQKPGLTPEDARRLVSRFLDGETTPQEERRLYGFFSASPAASLEPDLEQLRPMFAWYAGLSEVAESEAAENIRAGWWSRRWSAVIAVAAAVAVLVGIGVGLLHRPTREINPLYASYEGSYIVRNGVRTTDLALIYATVAAAEQMADSLNMRADRELLADRDYDRQAIDEALSAIKDPVLVEQLRRDLLD